MTRESGKGYLLDGEVAGTVEAHICRTGLVNIFGSHWDGGPHPALNQSNNVGGIGLSNQELFSQRGAGLVAGTVTAHIGGQTGHVMRPDLLVTHTLRGEGFDASEDGTGRGTPLVAVYENHGQDSRVKDLGDTCSTVSAKYGTGGGNTPIVCFDTAQITSPGNYSVPKPGDPAPPLNTAAQHHVAFSQNGQEDVRDLGEFTGTLCAESGTHQTSYVLSTYFEPRFTRTSGGQPQDELAHCLRSDTNTGDGQPCVAVHSTVRRLTPRECERLQGFPDDHTAVLYRNKPACDGPRYKALGNSMAVPCVQFILENLQKIAKEKA